jgi:hypothetical protein
VKVFHKKIFLFIIILLDWFSHGIYAWGQTQTMVIVSPSSVTVRPACTDTIELMVQDVANLFAASVTLSFDSTVLRFTRLMGGSLLNNNTQSVFLGVVLYPPPPSAPNKITVDQAILGGGTVSGNGILCTILFTALRSGSSPITIDSIDFRNGSNISIPTRNVSGQVIVNQPPSIISSPVFTAMTNKLYHYQVQANDPDGDTVRYGLIAAPEFLSVTSSAGLISGTPIRSAIGRYTIIVQVEDSKGESDQQSYTLTVLSSNNAPKAVQLLRPPNGSTLDTTFNVMLKWSRSIDIDASDTLRYEVHLANSISGRSFINLSDTTLTLTKDILKQNTQYTWNVDVTDGMDTSSSIDTFTFKTPALQYPGVIQDAFRLVNFPNPFDRSTVIQFSVPIAAHVSVTIYDLAGREIVRLLNKDMDAGNYSVPWNGKNYLGVGAASGIYLYELMTGSNCEVKKMVYLK